MSAEPDAPPEEGRFYWIRIRPESKWQIAQYADDGWWPHASDWAVDVEVIGPRIDPPDE